MMKWSKMQKKLINPVTFNNLKKQLIDLKMGHLFDNIKQDAKKKEMEKQTKIAFAEEATTATTSNAFKLDCLAKNTCNESEIYCSQFGYCNIYCDGESSCENSKIYCPDNENCDMECTDDYSCCNSVIYCPRREGNNCSIDCTSDNACRNMRVYCYDDNVCQLGSCEGVDACTNSSIIYRNSSTYDNLIITTPNTTQPPTETTRYPSNYPTDNINASSSPTTGPTTTKQKETTTAAMTSTSISSTKAPTSHIASRNFLIYFFSFF